MRTTAVLGASLLLLASLAAAGPAAATEETWNGKVDSKLTLLEGDFGVDGTVYQWDGKVCPHMGPLDPDEKKVDTNDSPETVEAPSLEGKVVWAYCVKSASPKNGYGPRIVILTNPEPSVTFSYPMEGKPKEISHYAVAYMAAPTPVTTTAPPTEEPTEESTTAPPTVEPGTDEPTEEPTEEPTTAPPSEEAGTDEPTDEESPLPTAPTDGSTPGMGGADYEEEAPVVEEARAVGDDGDLGRVQQDAATAATPESLPVTGAQVLGMVMAAVALVGAGVGALMWTRQRRAS